MTDADDSIAAPLRLRVRQMASAGSPPNTIRLLVVPQLENPDFMRIFAAELALGAAEADRAVAQTLFELAQDGKHLQATLAWARQRLGWSGESEALQHDNTTDAADSWEQLQALMDEFAAGKAHGSQPAREMAADGAAQPAVAAGG